MPNHEDVPFELKHYASPKSLPVGIADRRTGADTLLILSGTVILPGEMQRFGTSERVERKRLRFCIPQIPKIITAKSQLRGMQVVTAMASTYQRAGGERAFAIDQSVIEWSDELSELRIVIDTAFQGPGSTISRVMYNAFVLAQTA